MTSNKKPMGISRLGPLLKQLREDSGISADPFEENFFSVEDYNRWRDEEEPRMAKRAIQQAREKVTCGYIKTIFEGEKCNESSSVTAE